MYAQHNGSQWQTEVVACGGSWYGWHTSLELDSQGRPHISYCDCEGANELMYAWHDGVEWHIEVVDSNGQVGDDISLALDA